MFVTYIVSILSICWGVSPIAYANPVGASCTITQFSQVDNAVKSCTNIVVRNLYVPAKKTLTFNLKRGSSLTFEGVTTFGFDHWNGPLIVIQGEDLKVKGEKGSKLDGQGPKYWDGKGGGGVAKPSFIRVKGSGRYEGINLLNCPKMCTSVHGSHIYIDNWNIDVSAGNKNGIACNTDGFDVSGDNIQITNTVVKNQDDCVVILRGSNCLFKNVHCYGSHGLTVGAGETKDYENNHVRNVTFEDCTIEDATDAIHINSVNNGGKGLIEHITYNRITMKDITWNAIEINQDWNRDEKAIGHVPIRGLKISNLQGTMTGTKSKLARVICAPGSCTDFSWSNIKVTGYHNPCRLLNAPSGIRC